jgi:hypothetical protein
VRKAQKPSGPPPHRTPFSGPKVPTESVLLYHAERSNNESTRNDHLAAGQFPVGPVR